MVAGPYAHPVLVEDLRQVVGMDLPEGEGQDATRAGRIRRPEDTEVVAEAVGQRLEGVRVRAISCSRTASISTRLQVLDRRTQADGLGDRRARPALSSGDKWCSGTTRPTSGLRFRSCVSSNQTEAPCRTAPDAIQDLSIPLEKEAPVYTDYRQKHVTVPGLRPGETLEYDFVTVTDNAAGPGPVLDGARLHQERDRARRAIGTWMFPKTARSRSRPSRAAIRRLATPMAGAFTPGPVRTWTRRDDEIKKEDKEKKKEKPKKPEPPAVQMTTFASWEELGRWYAASRERPPPADAEIRAKAAELTQGKSD